MVNNIYEIKFEVTRNEYADFLIQKMLEKYFVNNSKDLFLPFYEIKKKGVNEKMIEQSFEWLRATRCETELKRAWSRSDMFIDNYYKQIDEDTNMAIGYRVSLSPTFLSIVEFIKQTVDDNWLCAWKEYSDHETK